MRIISGKFKGKKLIQPVDKNTRPLKDITKESIFNLIVHSKLIDVNFEKSIILDLFAGSGSFGIECLSRYSRHVTFIENYKPAVNTLKKNINLLNPKENYEIIEKDIFDKNTLNYIDKKFDIIFLDPPYKEEKIKELFNIIFENKILDQKGFIIIHRNKKSPDIFPDNFKIIDTRNYGISKIFFLKLK